MKELSLHELARQIPASRDIFEKYRIDYCCGGKQSLESVCNKRGLPLEEIVKEIGKKATHTPDHIDFSHWPLDLLTDYIEKKHHRYVRETIPVLTEKFERLVLRHGIEHPFLNDLKLYFEQAAEHLTSHMQKEERIVFPYIREMMIADSPARLGEHPFFGQIQGPISVMEREHETEGVRFEKMAELTNGYTPPAEACATWQYVYWKLKEFETDLHLHIYLENALLFPGIIELEKKLENTIPA